MVFMLTQLKNNQIWPFEIKNCGGSKDYSDTWGGLVECVNSQSFLVCGPSNHKHYYILGPGESMLITQLTYGNIESVLHTTISILTVLMKCENTSLKVNIFHIVFQWNQWNWIEIHLPCSIKFIKQFLKLLIQILVHVTQICLLLPKSTILVKVLKNCNGI